MMHCSFVSPKFILAILVCISMASVHTYGQFEPYQPPKTSRKKAVTGLEANKFRLRWYFLGFVNMADPNLTVGAEYAYNNKKSIGFDVGYIFASNTETPLDAKNASGFQTKLSHRWYLSGGFDPVFLEAELFFKSVSMQPRERWVNRGVVAGVPAYEQLMEVQTRKHVFSIGPRLGQHIKIDKAGKYGFEWAVGVGMRYRRVFNNLPADAELPQPNVWLFGNLFRFGQTWRPDVTLNLRATITL